MAQYLEIVHHIGLPLTKCYKHILYADFKAKQDVWNDSVKLGGIITFYFPVNQAKAGQPWTLSQAVHLAKKLSVSDVLKAILLSVLLYKCCQHTGWQTQSKIAWNKNKT